MLNKGIQVQGSNIPPYTFTDEETKKKIKRHLTDINDVITEKDIKNAKVPGAETTPPAEPVETPDLLSSQKKFGKKKNKPIVDESPGNPITPWDVLSE